jgi:DNA-nicking Smr family endonuclease
MAAPSDDQFAALLGDDVTPLRREPVVETVSAKPTAAAIEARRRAATANTGGDGNPLDSAEEPPQLDPYDFLEFVRPGVQQGVYRNLRLGKYELQARLDLHGLTVEQSRTALWQFARDCQKNGVRCALVTHGKGAGRAREARLKSCIAHWLPQIEEVLAFHSAQRHHGGLGACYVLWRKNSEQRLKTAEKLEQSRKLGRL